MGKTLCDISIPDDAERKQTEPPNTNICSNCQIEAREKNLDVAGLAAITWYDIGPIHLAEWEGS